MALSSIEQVRFLIQDNTPGLYLISDEEIYFLLQRNNNNVDRTALEAAKVILLSLSMRGDQTVDIFSVKGSKAAEQYRMALQLFVKSPDLNPILKTVQGWIGGVSKTEMQLNDSNTDNNTVDTPAKALNGLERPLEDF
jgi:hypothetical protein